MDDILAAVDAIESDYDGHCRAAREIGAEYFGAEEVVGSLMERAGTLSPHMAAPVAIVAGYLVGNPVGGHVLSILHWLAGLRRLGYDVVFVEHHGWPDACWNPRTKTLSDDPTLRPRRAGRARRPASGCAAGVSSISRTTITA